MRIFIEIYARIKLHRVTVGGYGESKEKKIKYLGHSSMPMQLDPYYFAWVFLRRPIMYKNRYFVLASPLKMSIEEHSREKRGRKKFWDYVTCHSKSPPSVYTALRLIDVNSKRPPQRIEMELHN